MLVEVDDRILLPAATSARHDVEMLDITETATAFEATGSNSHVNGDLLMLRATTGDDVVSNSVAAVVRFTDAMQPAKLCERMPDDNVSSALEETKPRKVLFAVDRSDDQHSQYVCSENSNQDWFYNIFCTTACVIIFRLRPHRIFCA